MKKYLNIREVSIALDIREHTIRYWDSIDPKTNQLRIEGLSTKSRGGTRYFNKENINKLKDLKNLIYDNGFHNPSIKIASKILSSKKLINKQIYQNSLNEIQKNDVVNDSSYIFKNAKKIDQILQKMRNLLK